MVGKQPPPLFLLGRFFLHPCHRNGQVVQLLLVHHVRAVHHKVGGILDLGEGDDIPDRGGPGHEHQGSLDMAYELYMTFYEKSAYIDAAAVCGNTVVAYSSDPKIDASFMETNSQKIIRKNGYKVTVKIFTDLRPFLERLDSMNDHRESLEEGIKFTPDEKYPDLSRNELIRQTILALCL